MSKQLNHPPYLLAVMGLLLASLACSVSIDPFGAGPIPATVPANPPSSTPLIVPPTLAPVTMTPSPIPSTSTPAPEPVASPSLQSFKMLDPDNGWAVSNTNVLRSGDGGVTWLDVTPAGMGSINYPATFFLDANRAWILAAASDYASGTLYHTQDGGQTWSSSSVPFAGGNLQFLDPNNGFVLASLGAAAGSEAVAVYQTGDGGGTWTRNYVNDPTVTGAGDSLPFSGDKTGMTFRDNLHGWVSGETPVDNFVYFYASADGGHSWAQQNVTLPPVDSGMFGANAPIFFDQNKGVLPASIVGSANSTIFFTTQDGGSTWLPTSAVTGLGKYSLVSASQAFVWDGGPVLYFSQDGMLNWTQVHPNITPADNLSAIQFVDVHTGWMLAMDASSHASLYKTTDGGATWTALIP